MIFADAAVLNPEAINPTAIGMWIVILGVVLGIYHKLRKWEAGVRGEGEKREVGPIPLPVAMAKEYVHRDSYNSHCALNREAHEKLQAQIDAIRAQQAEDKIEIIEAGNDRAQKIQDRVSAAFEKIGEQIGELRGEMNARTGGGPRR